MSSQTNNIIVTMLFSDETRRNVTFEDVPESALDDVKVRIRAINENANNEYENFYKTFVSNDGAPFSKIDACKIQIINEEVVYSG